MRARRFSLGEISAFQLEAARGATQADVARKHGFSPANFRRWFMRHGKPSIAYEPTRAERARAGRWHEEKTASRCWAVYRGFASDGRWANDGDLPEFVDEEERSDEFERLHLRTRPDGRVLLVCEKMEVQSRLDDWKGRRPSVAHATKTALAWFPPLASRWVARTLQSHAASLRAPLAFFGDLDPQALHAFAALRAGGRRALLGGRTRALPVTWLGLDSRWLDWSCGALGMTEAPRAWMIQMNWLDEEYWRLVKRLVPDVRQLVGRRAYNLLESGQKIEVEAVYGLPFVEELGRRLRVCAGRAI